MRKIVLSIFAVLAVSISAMGQNQRVSGTVTDSSGAPMAGVTVIVAGTQNGVATVTDGSYSIQVPANGSLTFSFAGKKPQTIAVERRTVINISLEEDSQTIGDVLVIAFGQASKTTFTGSASQFGDEELSKRTSTSVVNTLAGMLPGVQIVNSNGQPGSEASIRIRGVTSISAGTSPLIVLDGMVYTGGMETINNADIETFTVLKDAASAALYGSRGANGVIMITTKKGKVGEAKVFVDAKYGLGTRALKNYDVITDPGQHYETVYSNLYNYYYNGLGQSAVAANTNANTRLNTFLGGYVVYNTGGNPLIGMDGKLQPGATLGNVVNGHYLTPDNWEDAAYKTSTRQEYNVNVRGGNDRSSFFGSIGYLDEEGLVVKSGFERITGRLNADYKAKSWLKVGGNVSFSHANFSESSGYDAGSTSSGNIFAFTSRMAPIFPLYVRDNTGNIMQDAHGNVYDYGDGITGLTRPWLSGANPLQQTALDESSYDQNQFNVFGFAEVNFTKELKLTINGASSIREVRYKDFTNPYYGQYASSNGILQVQHTRNQNINLTQMLDYTKSFGKHSITAMVGHDYSTTLGWALWASRNNFLLPDVFELSHGASDQGLSGGTFTEYVSEGYLGRATYDYDQKYFGTVSFRRDASSRFHPDHRWGNFWSLSAGWIINREDFMQNVTWVDLLKFKASLGQRGNDQLDNWYYTDLFRITLDADGKPTPGFYRKGNPNITWETVTDLNVGFDFGLFDNKLTGTLEYYSRTASDLLFNVPQPPSSGILSGMVTNAGDMRNSGFELDLHGVIYENNNIRVGAFANITTNKSVVLKLPNELISKDLIFPDKDTNGFQSGDFWIGEGDSYYTYYLKKYAGVNEYGESLWYKKTDDGNGGIQESTTKTYSEASYYKLDKTAQPDAFGGFGLTFEAYGFDLTVNFDYQIGGYSYDSGYANFMRGLSGNGDGQAIHKDILNSWSPNNTSSNIPRWQFNDVNAASSSDRFLTSSSYLNFGSINFGYTLPSSLTKKIGVGSLRIYGSIENLNYWSARQGMDPRGSFSGGVALANYSPIRTVSGGLQVTF